MRGKGGSLKNFLLRTIEGQLTGTPDHGATLMAWDRHSPTAQVAQSSTSPAPTHQVSKPGVSVSAELLWMQPQQTLEFPHTYSGCLLHLCVDAPLPQGCPQSSRSRFGAEVAFAAHRHHPAAAQNPSEPGRAHASHVHPALLGCLCTGSNRETNAELQHPNHKQWHKVMIF